jgi:hypothetical protein
MMERIIKIAMPVAIIFLIFLIYSSCCTNFASNLFRWGEIVVIIFLLAGVFQLIIKESVKVKKFNSGSFYSAVTVIAFVCTFMAGLINYRSDEFAFSNIVREQPQYLVETAHIVIDDDEYLRKFPAKRKLSLLMASRISSYFVPTDDMLKNSGMSPEDYRDLINPRFLKGTENTIMEADRDYAQIIQEKVKKTSRDAVKLMLPVVKLIREWAYAGAASGQTPDLNVNGKTFKGSGLLLKEEIEKVQPIGDSEETAGMVDVYSMICKNGEFLDMISDSYAQKVGIGISEKAEKLIIESFVKTGVTFSPRMKGVVRWIYRYVYDPLFSTFMAILAFFMIIAAYRHFDLRKYSTAVITVSAVLVMLGFLPQIQLFLVKYLPAQWQGPLSTGWIMNYFAMPVFKAFAIGTGTGVIFMYISRYWRFFLRGDNNDR